jgi:transcriptional regulator
MIGNNQYKNRIELLQGTLDMLILRTLQWGPSHGYGIVQALRTSSGDALQVETGSLYPALHRLERRGWLSSEWKVTESNQRAKVYRITATGKRQLAVDHGRWKQMVDVIDLIMQGDSEGGKA